MSEIDFMFVLYAAEVYLHYPKFVQQSSNSEKSFIFFKLTLRFILSPAANFQGKAVTLLESEEGSSQTW